jgi:hypothetical protein
MLSATTEVQAEGTDLHDFAATCPCCGERTVLDWDGFKQIFTPIQKCRHFVGVVDECLSVWMSFLAPSPTPPVTPCTEDVRHKLFDSRFTI